MNNELYFEPFVIPFTVGVVVLFVVVIYRWLNWFFELAREDKRLIGQNIFTKASLLALLDVARESLLHLKIYKASPRLGYMHMSLALGWFLLIVVGKFETSAYLKDGLNLPHVHVFFRYFFHTEGDRFVHYFNYKFIMDFLLLFVLSGVFLAYFKRLRPKALGIKRTTKHTTADRLALSALWLVFPARLLAESVTCGIYHTGSFLTNTIGDFLAKFLPLQSLELPAWFLYSTVLGVFFCAFPFSRYMHIFAEIPHIFLKRYGVKVKEQESVVDKFQIDACSRCGICLDPCQMQSAAGVNDMQAVYFLRERRGDVRRPEVVDNCLMCGRCENICPVGIDLNALRLNTKRRLFQEMTQGKDSPQRLDYIQGSDTSKGAGRVGYFAGCMTSLTPSVNDSMRKIFAASGQKDVWFADVDGGVCCGRPMELAGDETGAAKLREFNKELFNRSGIEVLVTSCPICYKVFTEKYALSGIRVMHHSEYISELIKTGQLTISPTTVDGAKPLFTYHDPCELGRTGGGIYRQPREIIQAVGRLVEPTENGVNGGCCGGSLANTHINEALKIKIATQLTDQFEQTGAQTLVTACPMCKRSLTKSSKIKVRDLSEIVADRI